MINDLFEKLNGIKVISLDVFDTLIFRATENPSDIFKILYKKLIEKDLLDFELSKNEFKIIRIDAEKRAREKQWKLFNTKEVGLKEIYNEVPEFIINNKQLAINEEIETEAEYCYINPEILKLTEQAYKRGIKVVLTSDMYLTSGEIKYILEKNKFNLDILDHIFVSCENKCSKQDGSLFNIILERYKNIEPCAILHIGDNKTSDYENPASVGITSFFYDIIPYDQKIFKYEKISYNSPVKELLSLRKLMHGYCKNDIQLEVGSLVIGPFLALFIDWTVSKLEKYNIKSVYPLMREGTLLAKLLEEEIKNRNLKIKVKPIYVSRKSSYVPSIKEFNREVVEKLFMTDWTVENVADIFQVSELKEQFNEYMEIKLKDSTSILIGNESLSKSITEFMLSEKNVELINKNIKKKRSVFNQYLSQEIDDFENAATVDIWFGASIQANIESSLNYAGIKNNMYHIMAVADERVENKIFSGMKVLGFLNAFSENIDIVRGLKRNSFLYEKLVLDSIGTTLGYALDKGGVIPKTENLKIAKLEREKKWWQGILEFQRLWFYFKSSKQNLYNDIINNKNGIIQIIYRMAEFPTNEEVDFLGDLTFDDDFGINIKRRICVKEEEELVEKYGEKYVEEASNLGFNYLSILWSHGIITKVNPNYFIRKYLEENSYDEYFNQIRGIVERIKADNLSEIVIYGAGEVGSKMIEACKLYNIKVVNIVDRKESLWGTKKDGIEVISLEKALRKGYKNYAIASFAFLNQIKDTINIKSHEENVEDIKVFSI